MPEWVGPRSNSLAHISAPRAIVLFSGEHSVLLMVGSEHTPSLWDTEPHSGAHVEMSIFLAVNEGTINEAGAILFKQNIDVGLSLRGGFCFVFL